MFMVIIKLQIMCNASVCQCTERYLLLSTLSKKPVDARKPRKWLEELRQECRLHFKSLTLGSVAFEETLWFQFSSVHECCSKEAKSSQFETCTDSNRRSDCRAPGLTKVFAEWSQLRIFIKKCIGKASGQVLATMLTHSRFVLLCFPNLTEETLKNVEV